jgi:hypothetical protein
MIKAIEELSLNSWPSIQTMLYDGWVIRFANGFTKRSNSVSPLFYSTLHTEEKIRYCEKIYQRMGLDVVFKITPSVYPENLDKILESKGYIFDSQTSVQILELSESTISPTQTAILSNTLSKEWLSNFCKFTGIKKQNKSTFKKILNNIVTEKCFASIGEQDHMISYGLAVLQDKYVGLYDIVTDINFRNQGFGKEIVLNLLNWGKNKGAKTAYLHVMVDNEPALKLYSNLGFEEFYTYWYRIRGKR